VVEKSTTIKDTASSKPVFHLAVFFAPTRKSECDWVFVASQSSGYVTLNNVTSGIFNTPKDHEDEIIL
jgi:hypothetical protein